MSSIDDTPSFSVCAPHGRINVHRGRLAFPRRVLSIKPHPPPACQIKSTLLPLFYICAASRAKRRRPVDRARKRAFAAGGEQPRRLRKIAKYSLLTTNIFCYTINLECERDHRRRRPAAKRPSSKAEEGASFSVGKKSRLRGKSVEAACASRG